MNPNDVKQVGKWRVIGLIGQGGMSWVYQVLDPRLGAVRALKMLKPAAASAAGYKGFLREAQILASIDDDFLVRIYDLDKDPETGNDYYVMELLSGSDLKQYLRAHGPLEAESARAIFSGALQALGRLHTQSPPIIHRDIKPGNIQITESGRPKLLDLGIAKVTRKNTEETVFGDDSTVADMFKGTVLYASPEQLAMQESGPQADVFAMGLCLYEALEGRHAYAEIEGLPDPTNSHVLYQDVFRFYTRLEAVQGRLKVEFKRTPKPLQTVIRKALEIEPRLRFHDANEMRAALLDPSLVASQPTVEQVVRQRPEAAKRAEPRQRPGAEAQPVEAPQPPTASGARTWKMAAAGAAIVACLAGAGILLWRTYGPEPGPAPSAATNAERDTIAETGAAEPASADAGAATTPAQEQPDLASAGANAQATKLALIGADDLNAKLNAPEDYAAGVASQTEGRWDEATKAFARARENSARAIEDARALQQAAEAARERSAAACGAASGADACANAGASLAEGTRALEELRASDAATAFRAAASGFELAAAPLELTVEPQGTIALDAGKTQRFLAATRPPGAKVIFLIQPPGGVKPYQVMGNPYAFAQKQPGRYQITVSASDAQNRQAEPVEISLTVRPAAPAPQRAATSPRPSEGEAAGSEGAAIAKAAPAPVAEDPLAEARTLLQRFRAAIEGRDMDRLRAVWKIDRESEEGFQHLFDNADDITVVADPIGPIQPKGGDKGELRFRQRVTTKIGGETQDIVPLAPYRAELLHRAGGWQIIGMKQD
jgi:PAS domain-containing protein